MPNTAVKAANAESTWGEAPWEDRKPLIQPRSTSITKCFFFCRVGSLVADTLDEMSKDDELAVIRTMCESLRRMPRATGLPQSA